MVSPSIRPTATRAPSPFTIRERLAIGHVLLLSCSASCRVGTLRLACGHGRDWNGERGWNHRIAPGRGTCPRDDRAGGSSRQACWSFECPGTSGDPAFVCLRPREGRSRANVRLVGEASAICSGLREDGVQCLGLDRHRTNPNHASETRLICQAVTFQTVSRTILTG